MPTYLISQATGQQSQAVITNLLKAGHKIHAVVRDPSKKMPEVLQEPGVTIFKGDSTDSESIFAAGQGCEGVYLNTYPQPPSLEQAQTSGIIAGAKKAGIKRIVASTTLSTGMQAAWDDDFTKSVGLHPYFSSKRGIEDQIRAANFDAYTILRPAFIHFDYFVPASCYNYPELSTLGELHYVYSDGGHALHTDANDVGRYAAAAFENPDKFHGAEIDLGYEVLTQDEVAKIITRVVAAGGGKTVVKAVERPDKDRKVVLPKAPGQIFHYWRKPDVAKAISGQAKDVQEKYGIPFTSLEEALTRDRARLIAGLPQ